MVFACRPAGLHASATHHLSDLVQKEALPRDREANPLHVIALPGVRSREGSDVSIFDDGSAVWIDRQTLEDMNNTIGFRP